MFYRGVAIIPQMKKSTIFIFTGVACALVAVYLVSINPGWALTPSSAPLAIAAFVCFWLANKDAKKAREEAEGGRVRRR